MGRGFFPTARRPRRHRAYLGAFRGRLERSRGRHRALRSSWAKLSAKLLRGFTSEVIYLLAYALYTRGRRAVLAVELEGARLPPPKLLNGFVL